MDFQTTKEQFKDIFLDLIDLLEKVIKIVNTIDRKNAKLKEFLDNNSDNNFRDICNHIKINLSMIERNYMKCVIFGKTSNGKSAILNAILKKDIFPSSKGRTTSCFISVEGCDDDEVGFILNENDDILDVGCLKDLASEYGGEKCDIKNRLRVFYPRSKCEILKHDVVLFDTPGVDFSKENDKLIKEYCEDADVFLLAVDGCSTLNESEKLFFRILNGMISIPSILVLINKWDIVLSDEDMNANKVKDQHEKEVRKFLKDDLKLYGNDEISRRIFFISALESLREDSNIELQQSLRNDSFHFQDFQRFQETLKSDLCANAIRTKFQRHYMKGREIINILLKFSSRFSMFIQKINQYDKELKDNMLRKCKDKVFASSECIKTNCMRHVELESGNLALTIKRTVEKKSNYVDRIMKMFEESMAFSIGDIYEERMTNLLDELKKIFMDNSTILMTKEQIKIFFNENLKFGEVVKDFKEHVQNNFSNTASNIKNVFQDQHDNEVTISRIKDVLRYSGPILMAAGTALLKKHPATAAIITAVSIACKEITDKTEAIESKTPMEENIKDELCNYFNEVIKFFHDQNSSRVDSMVCELVNLFVNEQLDMVKMSEHFEIIKDKSEMILSRLEEIHSINSHYFQ